MDQHIRQLCCRDIGGDQQQLHSVQTRHVGVTFKHVLLPVWLANYRYHEKVFRVIVNGRTGEIMGDRPYSWAKIALLVIGIILAIVAAVLVFSGVAKGGEPPARRAHQADVPAPVASLAVELQGQDCGRLMSSASKQRGTGCPAHFESFAR
jgi:hypothetical protein